MPESRQDLREKLQTKLRELFQFNVSDLDFGIYRILNHKKDEIEQFIQQDLLEAINKGLEEYGQEDENQLEELRQKIKNNFGDDAFENGGIVEQYQGTPLGKDYLTAKEQAEQQEVGEEIEKQIYQDLYTFFSRYYDDGDFLTQRRISTRDSKYAIPYNGEEVMLHWANKDQYYIKTGEHFADYKFEANNINVWFKVEQAQTEKDNIKESDTRYFLLKQDDAIEIDEENDILTLWFEYRPITDDENKQWLGIYNKAEGKSLKTVDRQRLCIAFDEWVRNELSGKWRNALSKVPDKKERSLLYTKLNHFTAKNTSDYFIHKNLQDFLNRELEYYLKHEVIRVDDFIKADSGQALQTSLTRAKVVRSIGDKIIAFLSQIENFQKKLFEKKKFIVDTHYCFTLDKVPEELYETILENEQQLDYWEECYAIDKWEKNLEWNGEWTEAALKSHPFIMVDTKFFEDDFKYELLASFDDLDQEMGGLLVNGENYQAINLLKNKNQNRIKYIYLDPPYNAQSSEIIYKNSFKHSSWLSLMENRISLSKNVQSDNGVLTIAIDEVEQEKLGQLLSLLYPNKEKSCLVVNHNPSGQQGDNFSFTHEYAYFIYPQPGRYIGKEFREKEEEWDERNFRDVTGEDSLREAGKNCFFPIYIKDEEIMGFGDVCDADFHPEMNEELEDGTIAVYPIDPEGIERKWRFSRHTVESIEDQLKVHYLEKRDVYDIKRLKKRFNFKTNWFDSKYSGNNHGTQILNQILPNNSFSYPKSIYLVKDCITAGFNEDTSGTVFDYFAGSGTTGHAIIKLNREDEGDRNYILVEMGKYFNTVLKPRLQKVTFSDNWKDGVPQDKDGQSHAFKYHFIESYEDALNNIEFKNKDEAQGAFEFDDYMLRYMLDFETEGASPTLLKEEAFETPFDYQLKIQRGHESPAKENVDLVETFHYLIGLWVKTLRRVKHQERHYIVSTGQIRSEDAMEDVLVVWRNTKDLDLDKEAKWLQENIIKDQTFDRMYINGNSKIKEAEPTEITFREKMFE